MSNNDIPEDGDIVDYILDGLDDDDFDIRDNDDRDETIDTAKTGTPDTTGEADTADETAVDAALLRLLGSNIHTRNPAAELLDRLIDPTDAPSLTLERRQHLVASVRARLELRARNRGLLPSVLGKYRETGTQTHEEAAVSLAKWVANLGEFEGRAELDQAGLQVTPRLVSEIENGKKSLNTPEVTVLTAVWARMQKVPLDAARDALRTSLDALADDPFVPEIAAGLVEGAGTGTQSSANELLSLFTQAYQAAEQPGG